jgi:2-keto-4-pentenoate hydratase/2-oxohepta-3-ene-1,7-dioic acid hydratase in catechol pathway
MNRLSAALTVSALLLAPLAAEAQGAGSGEAQRIVRYQYQGRSGFGRVEGDVIRELPGSDIFSAAVNAPTGRSAPLDAVRILPPLQGELVEKVIGVSGNTARPGRGGPVPHPRFYALFPSSLNRHDGDVEVPGSTTNFTVAGGLAVIIGRGGREITVSEAPDYVWGVTAAAQFYDVTWANERRGENDPSALIARAADGWASLGPWVTVGLNWSRLAIETRINGQPAQVGTSEDLVNGIPSLISTLSQYVTLQPGDILFTGSVPWVEGAQRTLSPGDVVEVEVAGVGVLRNTMVPMGRDR